MGCLYGNKLTLLNPQCLLG